jgi:osmoprotectant transport system ATP-binding protein
MMIVFNDVSKVYEDGTTALSNINLKVKKGELLTLIGPSGCGKTTTMKMINRLIEPTSGSITIDGEDISKLDPVELRRNIGYVIQQIGLLPHMTISENISLIPKLKKWSKHKIEKRVDELLDLVGLDPTTYKERYPLELSGGQQQRIGVIRALAAEPPIILMDEPFSALDPISREQLQGELIKLQEAIQKTIVFVTHDMDEAIKIANRIAVMRNGKLVQLDTPEQVLRQPKDEFVKEFIGDKRLNAHSYTPTASDLMFSNFATTHPNNSLNEALTTMKKSFSNGIIVLNEQDHLVGIVSSTEIEQYDENESLLVNDVMETNYKSVSLGDPLSSVAEVFTNSKQNVIPVLEGEKIIGIITQTSMMKGLADFKHSDVKEVNA